MRFRGRDQIRETGTRPSGEYENHPAIDRPRGAFATGAKSDRDSPSERLHGISIGAKVEQPGDRVLQSLLQTLNNDPNVKVRLAAVDALYLFRNKTQVRQGLIESLRGQTSPLVQIALIDLLTEIREEKSIDALKLLIQENNLNLNVKERAETGLRQLL